MAWKNDSLFIHRSSTCPWICVNVYLDGFLQNTSDVSESLMERYMEVKEDNELESLISDDDNTTSTDATP